jgi:hypothetical protein
MMTEGEYTPERVRAEPNAAPVMIFAATGFMINIISERRVDRSLLDIVLCDAYNPKICWRGEGQINEITEKITTTRER